MYVVSQTRKRFLLTPVLAILSAALVGCGSDDRPRHNNDFDLIDSCEDYNLVLHDPEASKLVPLLHMPVHSPRLSPLTRPMRLRFLNPEIIGSDPSTAFAFRAWAGCLPGNKLYWDNLTFGMEAEEFCFKDEGEYVLRRSKSIISDCSDIVCSSGAVGVEVSNEVSRILSFYGRNALPNGWATLSPLTDDFSGEVSYSIQGDSVVFEANTKKNGDPYFTYNGYLAERINGKYRLCDKPHKVSHTIFNRVEGAVK